MEASNVNPRRPITVCFDAEIIRAISLPSTAPTIAMPQRAGRRKLAQESLSIQS
jgi:hypothetical protein